jgi:hypothetical protein
MAEKMPAPNQNAGGLKGQDRKQANQRDARQGAYDPVGNQTVPDTSQQTPHEQAQHGADVRGAPLPTENAALPEGLKRQRKGPYDRNRGRGETSAAPKPRGTIRGH